MATRACRSDPALVPVEQRQGDGESQSQEIVSLGTDRIDGGLVSENLAVGGVINADRPILPGFGLGEADLRTGAIALEPQALEIRAAPKRALAG